MSKTNIIPFITTPHVDLIELLPEHSKDVFDFASHEIVAKTVLWEAHRNVDDSIRYIQQVRNQTSSSPGSVFLSWGVRERETSKIVGLICLTQLAPIRAQIGYVFHYNHWNTKLPVSSIRAVLDYTFQSFLNFERLQCRCFPTNNSSIQLLEKVGFQFEGVNHTMVQVRGEIQDLTCFAMTRKKWNANKDSDHLRNDFNEHI